MGRCEVSLVGTVERLQASLDDLDADAMAGAICALLDLLGPQNTLTITKALLAERDLFHPRPLQLPSQHGPSVALVTATS